MGEAGAFVKNYLSDAGITEGQETPQELEVHEQYFISKLIEKMMDEGLHRVTKTLEITGSDGSKFRADFIIVRTKKIE